MTNWKFCPTEWYCSFHLGDSKYWKKEQIQRSLFLMLKKKRNKTKPDHTLGLAAVIILVPFVEWSMLFILTGSVFCGGVSNRISSMILFAWVAAAESIFSTRVASDAAQHVKCNGSTSNIPRIWLLMPLRRIWDGKVRSSLPSKIIFFYFHFKNCMRMNGSCRWV